MSKKGDGITTDCDEKSVGDQYRNRRRSSHATDSQGDPFSNEMEEDEGGGKEESEDTRH